MKPGTIFFDTTFKFKDGKIGEKFFIVLNDGSPGYYIIVKLTSIGNFKGNIFGCQNDDRYPNFFLVKNCCCLKKNTWVQLHEFYEFTVHLLLEKHYSGKINQFGRLEKSITLLLLDCAINCEDISQSQILELTKVINQLNSDDIN